VRVDKVAIVGLGSIGRRHLRVLKTIRPEIEISAVRSGLGETCTEQDLCTNVFSDLRQAIEEGVQAAIVASPATEHIEQAMVLAEAGVHLLVEKPLSHNAENNSKLVETVGTNGIVGLLGYTLRHDKAAIEFKKKLEQGLLGSLLHIRVECGSYLPSWRTHQDYKKSVSAIASSGGGVLLELSHELDYTHWFFGEMKSVFANIHNSGFLGIDVEESADLLFEAVAGFPVSVHLDFNRRHPVRRCSAYGQQGQLTWDAVNRSVEWRPADGDVELENFSMKYDAMYQEQLTHFLECIEQGRCPKVGFCSGETILKWIESARNSHETGKRVELS
jgi:predicted dehydrogenase